MAGRPRKNEEEKMNHVLKIRMTKDELDSVSAICKSEEKSISEFVRHAIATERKNYISKHVKEMIDTYNGGED